MVYLIHFDTPFKHARHYIGYAAEENYDKRIECHRKNRGSCLMTAVNKAGIGWNVVKEWPGADGNFERKLKNASHSSRHCPICKQQKQKQMKRLFIEIDEVEEGRLETLHKLHEDNWDFDYKIGNAGCEIKETWERVKECDEIYLDSALIPTYGISSDTLFNNLMFKAIEENVEGKSIYIYRRYSSVQWYNLRTHLVEKAFKKNFLYTEVEVNETHIREGYIAPLTVFRWEQVDIDKLIREELL